MFLFSYKRREYCSIKESEIIWWKPRGVLSKKEISIVLLNDADMIQVGNPCSKGINWAPFYSVFCQVLVIVLSEETKELFFSSAEQLAFDIWKMRKESTRWKHLWPQGSFLCVVTLKTKSWCDINQTNVNITWSLWFKKIKLFTYIQGI